MRITTTIAFLGVAALAIAAVALGCNNQTPPGRTPMPLPTQDTFGDIDSAMCAADSLLNESERLLGLYQTGINVDIKPTRKPPYRVESGMLIDSQAPIIEQ